MKQRLVKQPIRMVKTQMQSDYGGSADPREKKLDTKTNFKLTIKQNHFVINKSKNFDNVVGRNAQVKV